MILPFDAVGEGPPVVLLHAGIADRTMWREHLAPIADSGRRALALDLPGFGEAGLEPGPQSPLEDRLDRLAEMRMPALCSAGTRDKPDFVEGAKQMADVLPEGRHATIARAGHLAPLEQPRVFRRQLLGFLDELEGR